MFIHYRNLSEHFGHFLKKKGKKKIPINPCTSRVIYIYLYVYVCMYILFHFFYFHPCWMMVRTWHTLVSIVLPVIYFVVLLFLVVGHIVLYIYYAN